MTRSLFGRGATPLCAALLILGSTMAGAGPVTLELADPQPESLSEGLAVKYAYKIDKASLRDAYVALGIGGEAGEPLVALDYDAAEEEPVLTATQPFKVGAQINGYVRFDAAGDYQLEFMTNDGAQITLGGQELVVIDEKRGCDPTGPFEVTVPEAGWYALDALWFQWKGSSCLVMQWAAEGDELSTVPASAFGYTPPAQ